MYGKMLPFFFVTEDKNRNRSELGSVNKPTKPRVLFEYENIAYIPQTQKHNVEGVLNRYPN